MDDEFFKRFFAASFGRSPFTPINNWDNSDIRDQHSGGIDQDFNSAVHAEINDIIRQFAFGFGPSNIHTFSGQSILEDPRVEQQDRDLRSTFLKSSNKETSVDTRPTPAVNSFFGDFLSPITIFDESWKPRNYTDLNEQMEPMNENKNDSTVFTLENRPSHFEHKRPQIHSFGQSVSIRRVQRPDGSVEEIKSVKNSDGREEKTITRIIGDKQHSVIEKKQNDRIEETEEVFTNFDEKKMEEFNTLWSSRGKVEMPNANAIVDFQKPRIEDALPKSNSVSFISKLFSWLK